MEEVKDKVEFELPNKVVYVKPVKGRSWLPDNHAASFLFGEASIDYVVPKDKRGVLVDPLTPEERKYFEDKERSNMDFETGDLSVHKKEDNYWSSFKVKLDQRIKKLDLSKPTDYITYKVLLTNKDYICPNSDKESISRKWSYKFYIADEGEDVKRKATGVDAMKEAFKFYGKMSSSASEMINFLKQYKLKNSRFKKPIPNDAKEEWLKSEISDIIDNDLELFLEVVNDAYYEDKKLLIEGLEAGAILLDGRSFQTPEGVHLGDTPNEVVRFLKDHLNNEIKLQILGRIENA